MKKVGIVGIGGVASYAQIPAYIEKGIRIQAICDINEEILNKIGDKYNISNRYTDIEEMIVKEKVDIIDVATPPQTHLDIIRIANKYNVEVIMQKPLIVDIKEFEQLKELINANKHLKLNLTGRYVSAWQKIKKILNNKEIGKPLIGDNDIRTWKLPRPGQKLPVESLENNWFIDSFGCAMADYLDYFNKNEKELEDKEYAIELTKLTFKVSEATKSNKWIEI